MPFSAFRHEDACPTDDALRRSLGATAQLWATALDRLASSVEADACEWRSFTQRSGWCLNVKDATGTLAYFYPQRDGFIVVVTIGHGDVALAGAGGLPADVERALAGARPFAKGWSVLVDVCGEPDVRLVEALCRVKRPRPCGTTTL